MRRISTPHNEHDPSQVSLRHGTQLFLGCFNGKTLDISASNQFSHFLIFT